MSKLRRHIMMQQGVKNIIGIGGDSIAQIVIPTILPTNSTVLSANLSVELYVGREINVTYTNYLFIYNKFAIGINAFGSSPDYNYIKISRIDYAYQNFDLSYDTRKIIIEPKQITILDANGAIISQSQILNWLYKTNIGGNLILQPNHYISHISAPGYFDLVAAEEGGRLGFRDTLSGTFYGQTNSEGELVALYEE